MPNLEEKGKSLTDDAKGDMIIYDINTQNEAKIVSVADDVAVTSSDTDMLLAYIEPLLNRLSYSSIVNSMGNSDVFSAMLYTVRFKEEGDLFAFTYKDYYSFSSQTGKNILYGYEYYRGRWVVFDLEH